MELANTTCVITGGASGIGAALAKRFIAEGASTVVIADLGEERTAAAASDIGAIGVSCDVTDEAAIYRLVSETEAAHGPINLFVSNAGFSIDGGLEVPDDGWQRLWDLHVMAHVYAARAVIPGMVANGGGQLVQTVSAAGMLASLTSLPYTVTKHASLALAEWLAITHRDQNIRVAAICPLVVETPLTPRFSLDGAGEPATPEQVADVVVGGLADGRFLILPHPEVSDYARRKADDPDRWLAGMARLWSGVMYPT
ncbi:MAG: SDR family oxidoreductase [Acidimicrobiia bacterium]|nr:SDR family oxidoreductase [Acidimicrobiia bacterium]